MMSSIFGVLEQGLKLWNSKDAIKYQKKLNKLKQAWHDEYNKPNELRDHNALDDIEFELRILSDSFIQATGSENSVV